MSTNFQLRLIEPQDNLKVAQIIRQVMTEFGAIGEGYSIEDPEVDAIYEAYHNEQSAFFVVEKDGEVYGCGGIGPLSGGDEDTCELKKMYFLPELRGHGFGKKMIDASFEAAKSKGYSKMYLETVDRMKTANMLYQKMGFEKLASNLGNTGHGGCDTYYLKSL